MRRPRPVDPAPLLPLPRPPPPARPCGVTPNDRRPGGPSGLGHTAPPRDRARPWDTPTPLPYSSATPGTDDGPAPLRSHTEADRAFCRKSPTDTRGPSLRPPRPRPPPAQEGAAHAHHVQQLEQRLTEEAAARAAEASAREADSAALRDELATVPTAPHPPPSSIGHYSPPRTPHPSPPQILPFTLVFV